MVKIEPLLKSIKIFEKIHQEIIQANQKTTCCEIWDCVAWACPNRRSREYSNQLATIL